MKIYDIHTHRPIAEAIFNDLDFDKPAPGMLYSVGMHPMYIDTDHAEASFVSLCRSALQPQVVAIGECGLDQRSSVPMGEQMYWLEVQVRLAQELGKPLIIHCVGAWSQLMELSKRIPHTVPWVLHGYRKGPELARQLLSQGINISLGPLFNPDTLLALDASQLLIETDDNHHATIRDVAQRISSIRPEWGTADEILQLSAENISRLMINFDKTITP